MAGKQETVAIQRENEKGKREAWRSARLELDELAGAIQLSPMGLFGGKWSITILPSQLSSLTIEMISDQHTLAMMYGGGLLGYGIAVLMSRWAKMPVIQLEQQIAEPGQKWVQIRSGGLFPRKTTRDLANRIVFMLQQRGYKGILPDLSDDTPWKYPIVPIVAGCGLVILVIVLIMVCLIAVSAYTGQ
jgi:hypothetical protein